MIQQNMFFSNDEDNMLQHKTYFVLVTKTTWFYHVSKTLTQSQFMFSWICLGLTWATQHGKTINQNVFSKNTQDEKCYHDQDNMIQQNIFLF